MFPFQKYAYLLWVHVTLFLWMFMYVQDNTIFSFKYFTQLYSNSTQFITSLNFPHPMHFLGRQVISIEWKVAFGLADVNIPWNVTLHNKGDGGGLHVLGFQLPSDSLGGSVMF